jgi:predicted phosphoribosyltransferase
MIIFKDRLEAGKKLAERLKDFSDGKVTVLAIPNGGVPVGLEIAKKLKADFDVLVVRKIQLPWNTEAGFGAIAPDGSEIFNDDMILEYGLNKKEIESQKQKTLQKINERIKSYGAKRTFKELADKTIVITDDGLASGYTMRVACVFIRKFLPQKIIVAVPCASADSYEKLKEFCDEIISLNIKSDYPFAVADFYKNWYDLEDQEVILLIKEFHGRKNRRTA